MAIFIQMLPKSLEFFRAFQFFRFATALNDNGKICASDNRQTAFECRYYFGSLKNDNYYKVVELHSLLRYQISY